MVKKIIIGYLIVVGCIVFMSCNNAVQRNELESKSNQFEYEVSERIQSLKENGLLDGLLFSDRAIEGTDSEVYEFLNNTDKVLKEIEESENGKEKIAIINSLFLNGNVDDFSNAFAKIDKNKADEFTKFINENLTFSDINQNSRSIDGTDLIKILYGSKNTSARTIYGNNFDTSTVAWYTGFCAATVAGFYAFSYGGIWLKAAGLVAATAGAASMVAQLTIWYNSTDLGNFVNSLINMDGLTATQIINGEQGKMIALVISETMATAIACYISPAGKVVVQTVIYYINLIIDKILAVLPSGVNYTINGIPLKRIVL